MKKRVFTLLLALCMIVSLLPFGASAADIVASDECGADGDNVIWTLDSDGVLTISGEGEMKNYYDFDSSSPENDKIKAVVIESGVTSIGIEAFWYCTSLMSIEIPDSVTSIGGEAFEGCTSLMSVEIPDSVTSIGVGAFRSCASLTSVTIPDSVTSIGGSVFSGCSSLTSIEIPDSMTSIGGRMFYYCSSLTNVTIPDSVRIIENEAFSNCSSLAGITIPNSVTSIGHGAFSFCNSLTNISIPDSVTSIDWWAFEGCTSLTSIEIPDSVTSIDWLAFEGCTSLTSIEIPDSVTSIGKNAFSDCTSLTSITLPGGLMSIDDSVFRDCSSLTSITLPDSVTYIGEYAFSGCTSLTSVDALENRYVYAGESAFEGCTKLGPRVQVSGLCENVFKDCTSLEEVIARNVSTIKAYALNGCTSLTTLRLDDSIHEVAANAFRGLDNLKDVYFCGTEDEWNAITIREAGNDPLKNATIHFNSHILKHTDAVEPTCTERGNMEYWTCELCGKMFSDAEGTHLIESAYVPAKGHQQELRNVVPATCTEGGYSGDTYCAICGELLWTGYYTPAPGHDWGKWTVTKEATETAEGVETRTCARCSETETRSIPKLTPKPADPTPASPQPTTKPDDTKPTPKPVKNPFTDVKNGDYFFEPVLWALNHDPQITDGMTETTFAPDVTCTRGQVVTFLWRSMGCAEPKSTHNPFIDVSANDYYYKAVLWAVEKGITDGTSDTTFSPNDPCTRAHVVTFLWRAESKPDAGSDNPFTDVTRGEYYTDAVLWAVSRQITDGTSETTFSPESPCTRGQIVTFLCRDMQ